ncbi:patatin-like phospholipase family protein [Notoacmeibacter ruber]|uniref:Patatin n=1 Tax=Notoacmeibacter ruber TaxID=2670375 RepID=A0A3L7JBY7_9HYPH|nr:patatin-like phospholipase family protein [Notoacmeibacter ruber]RLQ87990.1 Patatin [Notoacmeibacter ruber]
MDQRSHVPDHHPDGIALALGGGIGRGWIHIGVLRALDEGRIPINMIAGTSIGAIVAGAYLAGKLDELEAFARAATWRRMFGLFDLRWGGQGLVTGAKIERLLRASLGEMQIDDLDRPFVATATSLPGGEEVWISSGSLVMAMRASYAVPGIFEPISWGNRMLVDGALTAPLPVRACRLHSPCPVVGVTLSGDPGVREIVIEEASIDTDPSSVYKSSGVQSSGGQLGFGGVILRSFAVLQDQIIQSLMLSSPPDMLLAPPSQTIGLLDFHRADEAITIGYESTMAQIDEIRAFANA